MKTDVLNNIEIALEMKKNNLSVKEISEKMNRPVGTIKRWLAPYRLKNSSENVKNNALKASLVMQEKYAKKRNNAYEDARKNVESDFKDNLLRDFVNIYIGEGTKRGRNIISIVNSDAKIILLSLVVLRKYFLKETKKIKIEIRYYKENNNEIELLEYWKNLLNFENIEFRTYIQPTVKVIGHNNSNKYGLVILRINDTYAKEKLNAYMDYLKEAWLKEFEKNFSSKFIERD